MELPLGAGPKALRKENGVSPSVNVLEYSLYRDLLVAGLDDGSLSIRSVYNPDYFARILMHDGDRGHITGAKISYDDNFILSVGTDGLLVVYNLKKGPLADEAKVRAATTALTQFSSLTHEEPYVYGNEDAAEGSVDVVTGFHKVESSSKNAGEAIVDPAVNKLEGPDITDTGAYSIQDAKLKVGCRTNLVVGMLRGIWLNASGEEVVRWLADYF